MGEDSEVEVIDSTTSCVENTKPKRTTLMSVYGDLLAKKERKEMNDEGKKKSKKKRGKKSKKESDLKLYDNYLDNYDYPDRDNFNAFLLEQNRLRKGDEIPEELELGLYDESGFFFGMKHERNVFIGKPAHKDGHILVVGVPGSGKTMGVVIPTMMTWQGIQIIIDVKGDLSRYWRKLNGYTGKKVKVFSPDMSKGACCGYDPYALLRYGGEDNLSGNAKDLALALIPLLPAIHDPVWIQATQNFLTSVIIYHYNLGCTFTETMAAIQLSSIIDMIDEIMDDDNIEAKVYMSKLTDVQEKVLGNIGMELSNLATLVNDPAILTSFLSNEESMMLDWLELSTTTEPFDVILDIPEVNFERWAPMILLMINQLIKALEQRPQRTYKKDSELPPVLVMLDEFPRLGKISAIKNGLSTLRSRGVTFALFVQSFADLDETYGSIEARVIADICAYKVVLGITDAASQRYFSDIVGTTESTQRSVSVNHDPRSGRAVSFGRSISESREPIIYPHEFLTINDVVLITPYGFCRVNKTLFVENKETFLWPQLIRSEDYRAKNPLTYDYSIE